MPDEKENRNTGVWEWEEELWSLRELETIDSEDTQVSWKSEKNDTDKDGREGWTVKLTPIRNSNSKRSDILF